MVVESDSPQKAPSMTATKQDETNQHDINHPPPLNKKESHTTATTSEHQQLHPSPHSHHAHNGEVPFYAPPHQRQRWGDTQVAPHTNWGDLFFDVFYVAAAYNLGNMLKDTPSKEGLLYTAGIFFPIMNVWSFKVYYDSRFYYVTDYYHRIYEIFFLCTIATMILHIRSYEILSHPNQYPDMFIFCFSVCTAFTLALGRYLEIIICFKCFESYAYGLHIEAYHSAVRDLFGYIVAHMCVIAATVYSGIQYFSEISGMYTYDSDQSNTTAMYNATNDTAVSQGDTSHYRFLAESDTSAATEYVSDTPDNIPLWLLLGAVVASCAWFLFMVVYFILNKEKKQ
jgi:hypothetical protein